VPVDICVKDLWGREFHDADGTGSEYVEGMEGHEPPEWTQRYCTVVVRSMEWPVAKVLPISLSSGYQITKDKLKALAIGKALDKLAGVPSAKTLEFFVTHLSTLTTLTDEVYLDLAIAYLRRVHLYSYYDAVSCDTEGELLERSFHVRLADAGSLLKAEEEEGPVTDIFTQRHDTQIDLSLREFQNAVAVMETDGRVLINPECDEMAEAIKIEMEEVRGKWCEGECTSAR